MTLLVTGGCGFIGSNFVRRARRLRPDAALLNLDLLTYAGNLANLQELRDDPGYRFVRGDIADAELVERIIHDHAVDEVVHFAAESHVDRSILGPAAFVRTNVLGTATLLEAARKAGIRRFVHVSTDEVYGALRPDEPAFTEASPLQPRNPYSASKAGADQLVLAYHHTFDFPAVVTRSGNNYGPFQFPEKLIPLMIANVLEDKPIPVYGDGLQVRDWIHVEDHCAAIDAVRENGRIGEVYNIGASNELPNLTLVRSVLRLMGRGEDLIRFVQDRPGHDRRYALDTSRIRQELGWNPAVTFEDGLSSTVRWYIEHRPWWEAVRSGAYLAYYDQQYAARLESQGGG